MRRLRLLIVCLRRAHARRQLDHAHALHVDVRLLLRAQKRPILPIASWLVVLARLCIDVQEGVLLRRFVLPLQGEISTRFIGNPVTVATWFVAAVGHLHDFDLRTLVLHVYILVSIVGNVGEIVGLHTLIREGLSVADELTLDRWRLALRQSVPIDLIRAET